MQRFPDNAPDGSNHRAHGAHEQGGNDVWQGALKVRGVFSAVALLIVLAVVGLAVTKQLKSAGTVHATAGQPAASGVAGETPQQVQQRVRDDVTKALEQGAAARRQEPEQ